MAILNLTSIKRDVDGGVLFVDIVISDDEGNQTSIPNYAFRSDDPYGLSPDVKAWLAAHDGEYTIADYVAPVHSVEETRAMMPSLTSRQFWMAAANIDIDKDVIVTAIKAEVPDGVDRKMMIAELESGSFERLNPTIIDVMDLMDIPAYQVDDLWIWAAGL